MYTRYLVDPLHRLTRAYFRHLRHAMAGADIALPMGQVRAVKVVSLLMPEATPHALAQALDRDKAQITRLLNELGSAGLVGRHPHPDDGRRQLLTITAEGLALLKRLQQLEQQTMARMSAGLSDEDVAHFIRMADTMTANLDQRGSQ
ncbi:MarR family winged helix-turn-helix transcriptional regulator [Isoalcanivorax beigongshangi]|uniref:MarR family winged helix-turn-helix transcriptional regulator n=1 Tax=Isoalcanivorax beigongshangi TaxID=3238810 RepID=A0ABV4AFG3_9GAMM